MRSLLLPAPLLSRLALPLSLLLAACDGAPADKEPVDTADADTDTDSDTDTDTDSDTDTDTDTDTDSDTDTDTGKDTGDTGKDTGDTGKDTGDTGKDTGDTDPDTDTDTGPDTDTDTDTGPVDADGDGLDSRVDCNDADAAVGAPTDWYPDADGDGSGDASAAPTPECAPPAGYVPSANDCDDTDAAINIGGVEDCDGVDEDCDGSVDDSPSDGSVHYADADLDGYGNPADPLLACGETAGVTLDTSDCDDTSAAVSPSAEEDPTNGVDDDCDGSVDEAFIADVSGWSIVGAAGDGLGADGVWLVDDVDGDGIGELVVGSSGDNSLLPAGGIVAFHAATGAGTGVPVTDGWLRFYGDEGAAGVGTDIALLGDLDADGYASFAISAPYTDTAAVDAGTVYVLDAWSGATALAGVISPADADATITGAEADGWLGQSLASGDIDDDGAPDLVLSAPGTDAEQGSVYWFGSGWSTGTLTAADADATLTGGAAADQLGSSTLVVDLDADGVDDLVVCAPYSARGARTNVGNCYYVNGVDLPTVGTAVVSDVDTGLFLSENNDDHLGLGAGAIAAGDLDGDGINDLALAVPGHDATVTDAGAVMLFAGSGITTRNLPGAATLFVVGEGGLSTVAIPGDLDGDGAPDLLLGGASADVGGAVYTVAGTSTGTVTLPGDGLRAWTTDASGDALGTRVGGGADLDGDGILDLAATAPGNDGAGADAGAVFLFGAD